MPRLITTDEDRQKAAIRSREYYRKNRELCLAKAKAKRLVNRNVLIERCRKWREENRELHLELKRKQYRNNPKYLTDSKARRAFYREIAGKKLAMAYLHDLREVYAKCPKGYHVDHIVPLKHEKVSGLHVPWNLRYIPSIENRKKKNKFIEELAYAAD